jgi:tetratricopeptide (TPR) repeat protein
VAELRQRTEQAERDRRLVVRLEDLRLRREELLMGRRAQIDGEYQEAFKRAGLDVEQLTVEEVARRIRERDVREEIATALDDWVILRRGLRKDRTAADRLVRVARLADPDPWRNRLRERLGKRGQKEELLALARDRKLDQQPASSLILLSWHLTLSGQTDEALKVMRRAHASYPGDFWVNYEVGFLCSYSRKPPDYVEASRYLQTAQALNPRNPTMWANLGNALERSGKYEEAVAASRRAVELKPDFASGLANLGNALVSQGRVREAIPYLKKAVKRGPKLALAHNCLGRALMVQGKYRDALVHLRAGQKLAPDDPWMLGNLGACLVPIGPAQEAVSTLEKAIEAFRGIGSPPHDMAIAWTNLGSARVGLKQRDKAEAAYREALRYEPTFAGAHYGLGNIYMEEKKYSKSIAAFERALQCQPGYAQARWNLRLVRGLRSIDDEADRPYQEGMRWLQRGQPDKALAALHEARRLSPRSARPHIGLAAVYHKTRDLDRSVNALRDALDIEPRNAMAWARLALNYRDQGRLRDALGAARRAVDVQPGLVLAQEVLGELLLNSGDARGAVSAFEKAVRAGGKDHAHSGLGISLQQAGQMQRSVAPLERAVRLGPKNGMAWFGLARARSAGGDPAGCITAGQKALALGYQHPELHHVLGKALLQTGNVPGAVTAFQAALKLDQGNPEYLVSLGTARLAGGDQEAGITAYRQALATSPGHAPAWFFLAHALTGKGRFDEALRSMETAHELGRHWRGWPYPTAEGVKTVRRYVVLAERLPDVLADKVKPKDARERTELAWVCRLKGLNVAAVRQYELAFKDEPKLADDLSGRFRFHAAVAAARAATGKTEDVPRPGEAARVRLRGQALGWLRDDLKAWQRALETGGARGRAAVLGKMRFWKLTPDLAELREAKALGKLPEGERKEWQKFWADVEALRGRAENNP